MSALIEGGNALGAAHIATEDNGFYDVTLKNWATPLGNRDFDPYDTLNDFVSMIIGTVRDGRDARELLFGNFTYAAPTVHGIPPVNPRNNDHYKFLDDNHVSLRQELIRIEPQRDDLPDSAGLLTSRGWGAAHLVAGTNRRAVEFSFLVFMCAPIKEIADAEVSDWHVRRDVDRTPGGITATYIQSCRACHAGMDALGGAYGRYDFTNNQVTYLPGIATKVNKNGAVYPEGHVTTNDSWINYWTRNQNVHFDWRGNLEGAGVRSFGIMLANSGGFAKCMAKRTFKSMCRREPLEEEEVDIVTLAKSFSENGYNLRHLFEEAAILPNCLGN